MIFSLALQILDRAERYDLKSRFLLLILLFFFLFFLEGKRKGKKKSQSRDFSSCLSARSKFFAILENTLVGENNIGALLKSIFIQYCDSNTLLFSISHHIVLALPTL